MCGSSGSAGGGVIDNLISTQIKGHFGQKYEDAVFVFLKGGCRQIDGGPPLHHRRHFRAQRGDPRVWDVERAASEPSGEPHRTWTCATVREQVWCSWTAKQLINELVGTVVGAPVQ